MRLRNQRSRLYSNRATVAVYDLPWWYAFGSTTPGKRRVPTSPPAARWGIDTPLVYRWLKEDAGFPERLELAKRDALDYLAWKAHTRAAESSDSILMFALKRLHPAYKDPPKTSNGDGLPPFVPDLRTTVTESRTVTVEPSASSSDPSTVTTPGRGRARHAVASSVRIRTRL